MSMNKDILIKVTHNLGSASDGLVELLRYTDAVETILVQQLLKRVTKARLAAENLCATNKLLGT